MTMVVGKAVDAIAAVAGCLFTVEAVEQAAVDEGRLIEQGAERTGIAHFFFIDSEKNRGVWCCLPC